VGLVKRFPYFIVGMVGMLVCVAGGALLMPVIDTRVAWMPDCVQMGLFMVWLWVNFFGWVWFMNHDL